MLFRSGSGFDAGNIRENDGKQVDLFECFFVNIYFFVRAEMKKRVLILSGYLPRIYGGKNTGIISKGKNSQVSHNFNKGSSRFLIITK